MANEITFIVEKDEDSGWFVASWDCPTGGGITTQGKNLADLYTNIAAAAQCHFEFDRESRGNGQGRIKIP